MNETRIRLVTRGDDCGSCHSANVAICEAFEKGILRNTSIMVPCPAFDEAAEMLAGLPGLCLGLHITLNAEWDSVKWGPVLPPEEVPSLVDAEGHFLQRPALLHERGAGVDEMMAETRAQLDLARSRGLEISYCDQHMGLGWPEGLGERISELAAREGLIESHEVVSGLPPVEGEFESRADELIARLDAAPPGTYLVVGHPGYDNEEMHGLRHEGLQEGQVAREREQERRMFMAPEVLDYCAANGVEPIRYTEIQGD